LPERPHPAFAETTLPRDGQVGEGVSPALDAQTEKHNDPRRSTYSLQQRNDIECAAVIQKRIEPGSQQPEPVPQQALAGSR